MKKNIVNNAVDNFLQHINIDSSTLKEVCERFLWETIRELRKEDPLLYEEIYTGYSTKTQTKFLEERLEMEFFDESKVIEVLTDSMYKSLSRALEINECNEKNLKTILEDCYSFLSEDSEKIQQLLESDDDNGIIRFLKGFIKSLPSISLPLVAGGGYYFGLGFPLTCYVLLGIIVGCVILNYITNRAFGLNIHKEQLHLLRNTFEVFNIIGKTIKNSTEGVKYRYEVLYKNEEDCYKKAGLETKDIGPRMFMGLKDGSIFRQLLFFSEPEKLDKLRNCYMEHYLEKIGIFFDLYFDCLRKSGRWNEVRDMSDDKIISMFRIRGGLYPMCDEYRDHAVKAIKNYEDLVDFFFEKTPDQKSKWLMLLNRYILDSKTSRDEQMRQHRDSYNNPNSNPFVHNKYRKLGHDI